jgi:hypothetical protein
VPTSLSTGWLGGQGTSLSLHPSLTPPRRVSLLESVSEYYIARQVRCSANWRSGGIEDSLSREEAIFADRRERYVVGEITRIRVVEDAPPNLLRLLNNNLKFLLNDFF